MNLTRDSEKELTLLAAAEYMNSTQANWANKLIIFIRRYMLDNDRCFYTKHAGEVRKYWKYR